MQKFRWLAAIPAVALVAFGGIQLASASTSVSATTQIVNRPDSGASGYWGYDGIKGIGPMARTLTITQGTDCTTSSPGEGYLCYDATIRDSGDGYTIPNQDTPNQAGSYAGETISSPRVLYKINGEDFYSFWANETPAASNVQAYEDDHYGVPSGENTTSNWPQLAFPSETTFTAWNEYGGSWTYSTGCESWTDAASNGWGDESGDGNITGEQCTRPANDVVTLTYYCGKSAAAGFQFRATLTGNYEAKVNFVGVKDASKHWIGSYFIHPGKTDIVAAGKGRYGLGAYWDANGTEPAPHEAGALYTYRGAPSAASGQRITCS